MKNYYEINDKVWIHINSSNLIEGKIITILKLNDSNNNHYVIGINSSIEMFYEIRSFEQISSTANGPLNIFKGMDFKEDSAFLGKLGISLPAYNHVDEVNPTDEEKAQSKSSKKRFRYKKKKV
jgi:hypothetical protein